MDLVSGMGTVSLRGDALECLFVLGSLRRPQLFPTRSAHLEAGRQERWRGGSPGRGWEGPWGPEGDV